MDSTPVADAPGSSNPYQAPRAPSADPLGPDFQPRPMEIRFDFLPQDWEAFHVDFNRSSRSTRRRLLVIRFVLPVLFVAVPLLVTRGDRRAMQGMACFTGVMAIAWICWLPGAIRRGTRKRLKQFLAEGRNLGLVGEHRLSITPDEVREFTSVGDTGRRWSGVEKIHVTDDYAFIYLSAVTAFVVPKRAFATELAFQEFARSAQIWAERAQTATA